MMELFEIM